MNSAKTCNGTCETAAGCDCRLLKEVDLDRAQWQRTPGYIGEDESGPMYAMTAADFAGVLWAILHWPAIACALALIGWLVLQ